MKQTILPLALAALLLCGAGAAEARTIHLKGAAADDFIARHFPNASIPGPVSGRFVWIGRHGQKHRGYARCGVPAMGGRSDGEVSTCAVRY